MDATELQGTLDLWASMWSAEERASFERAVARTIGSHEARSIRLQAIAACHAIGTPALLQAAARASDSGEFTEDELAEVAAATYSIYSRLHRAERLGAERIAFLLMRAARDPGNAIAGSMLEHVHLRELWAMLEGFPDGELRREAASWIARRGLYQRRRLAQWLRMSMVSLHVLLAEAMSVDVALDDLEPAQLGP
jgi:hypothetical protein